jgi:hypothetical protein
MIINMVVSSPPELIIQSSQDMVTALVCKRSELSNSYNIHRDKLKDNLEYRTGIKR